MTTTYIIIAAGEASRWDNYKGTTKHYAILNGEPILERTIRLLSENDVRFKDVLVASKYYSTKGVDIYPTLNYAENADADKFMSTMNWWNDKGRTVVLYGDVYFTEDAIKKIVGYKERRVKMFCRPYGSKITGCRWGENFALSFYPEHQDRIKECLKLTAQAYIDGEIDRCGGWELIRALEGNKGSSIKQKKRSSPYYVIIDDLTDDIDFPADYDRLEKAIAKHS